MEVVFDGKFNWGSFHLEQNDGEPIAVYTNCSTIVDQIKN